MTTVHIKYFGVFRTMGSGIELEIPAGSTVAAVKTALWRALGAEHRQLVEDSVLADNIAILSNDAQLAVDSRALVILPPVCGG